MEVIWGIFLVISCFVIVGKNIGLINSKNMKVDIDNNFQEVFDEKGIFQEAMANSFGANSSPENQDLESTQKIDKKVSVGTLISNIKMKFGSTASRKNSKTLLYC